jgi:hypothetical protein
MSAVFHIQSTAQTGVITMCGLDYDSAEWTALQQNGLKHFVLYFNRSRHEFIPAADICEACLMLAMSDPE